MDGQMLRAALAGVRAGNREDFETLYRALSPPVYTVLLRLTGNRQTAEDLLQETFLKLYRSPPGEEVGNPRAWIFQVARNLALDELRRRRDSVSLEELEPTAPSPDPDQGLDVEAALARLGEEERTLVTLHLNGSLKFREVAAVLGLPLGTVLGRYYRAVEKLRNYLRA